MENTFSVNALLSPLSGLRGLKVSSLSPFGVLGSFLVEPSLAIVANLVDFLASQACFTMALFALTIVIFTLIRRERFAMRDQPLLLFPSLHSSDQAFALIPDDMPFFSCCLVLLVLCRAPLTSTFLAPSYLHTPWHTWLIPKSRPPRIDLDSLFRVVRPYS